MYTLTHLGWIQYGLEGSARWLAVTRLHNCLCMRNITMCDIDTLKGKTDRTQGKHSRSPSIAHGIPFQVYTCIVQITVHKHKAEGQKLATQLCTHK